MQARRSRILLAFPITLTALGLAVAHAATGQASTSSWQADAELEVTASGGDYPELDILMQLPSDGATPSRITIYAPRGVDLYPDRPPESAVGSVFIRALDSTYGTSTESTLAGDIVAQPAATPPADCKVDPPANVWQLRLSLLGQPLDVPLYLSNPGTGDPAGAGTKLTFCTPNLPTTDGSAARALPITALEFGLTGVEAPSRAGSYLWRAVVTPLAPDRRTPLPQHAYELRALVPVPHRLTLGGHPAAHGHRALLTGRLSANGKPQPGATVGVIKLSRGVTPTGTTTDDSVIGWARTDLLGRYSIRVRVDKTATFLAIARPQTSRCVGTSIAPAGCITTTTAPAQSEPVTVTAPRSK